ncbi:MULTISPECIES: hypothetical protein [Pseudomonas]|uniref:hypothetical protein n=1 Tax=Pseudomonas TaxID=286 RepID=UPI001F1394EC|nr:MULTISPECIES: hypothetical protein [Pseudomonas]
MSTLTMPGIRPLYAARRSELIVLTGEVVWFALHLSSLMLVGLSMFWSYRMIGMISDPFLALELFVLLGALGLYLLTATGFHLSYLLGRSSHEG